MRSIVAALQDRTSLGGLPTFSDLESWRRWLVFLRAVYGMPLASEEVEMFRRHTGRSTYAPPSGGWSEVVCITGRQSGKSRVAALIASYEAATAPRQPDGTEVYALLVAQDHRGAMRTLGRYATAPFEIVPALQRLIPKPGPLRGLLRRITQREDAVTLTNGVVIASYPCRPASVRGIRARVAICDELAYFRSSENLPQDVEMVRALRPTLATTGGKLVILSSPYAQAGALWDLHRQHYGRDDATTLVWQASAPEMNPTLPADYLERMRQDDPEAYRSEVLGEFRAGVSTFLDPEAVQACVAEGVRERAPQAGVSYVAFCDPSGGRRDRFALAVAHPQGEMAVLDAVRFWAPPFNPSGVVAEAVAVLRAYRVGEVVGDAYSAEFVAEQFRAHGISYRAADRDRSALYLDFLPRLNAGRVVLLDVAELLRELRGLERHRGVSGKDRVDHRPGARDDAANATVGVLGLVARNARPCSHCGEPDCSGFHIFATGVGWDTPPLRPEPARISPAPEPEAVTEDELTGEPEQRWSSLTRLRQRQREARESPKTFVEHEAQRAGWWWPDGS